METTELHRIAPALPYLLEHQQVWSKYDRDADVLYLSFTKEDLADDSEVTHDDVILRYAGDEVIGITILHASKR